MKVLIVRPLENGRFEVPFDFVKVIDMNSKLDQINLDFQYLKAKTSFQECITNPDNEYLNEQIEIPVSSIITKNESVKMQFYGSDKNHFLVETLLLLFTPSDKKIGYYCYHENENEEAVDDYLVFE